MGQPPARSFVIAALTPAPRRRLVLYVRAYPKGYLDNEGRDVQLERGDVGIEEAVEAAADAIIVERGDRTLPCDKKAKNGARSTGVWLGNDQGRRPSDDPAQNVCGPSGYAWRTSLRSNSEKSKGDVWKVGSTLFRDWARKSGPCGAVLLAPRALLIRRSKIKFASCCRHSKSGRRNIDNKLSMRTL